MPPAVLKPAAFVAHVLYNIVVCGLDQRNVLTLPLNFFLNFLPVATWLAIFKNAGAIPHSWRPPIHVRLAMDLDTAMFGFGLWGLATFGANLGMAYVVYKWFFARAGRSSARSHRGARGMGPVGSGYETDIELESVSEEEVVSGAKPLAGGWEWEYFGSSAEVEVRNPRFRPPRWLAPGLLAVSWVVLNTGHFFRLPLRASKDIVAWFFYVILHFCAPLFTAIYLYVFHAPGALATFGYCLGGQNIVGVLTHLAFPNAPPWFITLNGPEAKADYEMPGYAAGLLRVDTTMGTHMHSKGFHMLPIVFGALPLLHLAMAVQVCFFLGYFGRWRAVRAVGMVFVAVQWWATMYLDHHWRIDLYVGAWYAVVAFALAQRRLNRVWGRMVEARKGGEGRTMGMRVFRGTVMEGWFDPLA